MKLLIVDDQLGVLEGLVNGINWEKEGILQVVTAQNAEQARKEFEKGAPDIMLCDIEMPVENGLQLFCWVKDQQYETCCIFLTSHAEFDYAKEAIHLGAFDYILQPAPYQEVVETIRKAKEFLLSKRERQKVYCVGEQLLEDKIHVAASVQRDILNGLGNSRFVETMGSLGALPTKGKPCFLIMVQILRYHSMTEKEEQDDMAVEMSKLVNQDFPDNGCYVVVSAMGENLLAFILQDKNNLEPEEEAVRNRLAVFLSQCGETFKCSMAAYMEGPLLLREMADGWKMLLKRKADNVGLKEGVYLPPKTQESFQNHHYHTAGIAHWGKLLEEGYGPAMEEEAFGTLDEMARKGLLTSKTLAYFYQDFLHMLHGITGTEGVRSVFFTDQEQEMYQNGARSIDHMKALIHHVACRYQKGTAEEDQKAAVFQVIHYINEHLEEDLKRDDLAAYVHLNPDYMARIFKREIGVTIKEYIIQRKMREAQSLLKTTSLPVSFIAAKLGYSNFSYFSQTYKKTIGITPQEERSQEGAVNNN